MPASDENKLNQEETKYSFIEEQIISKRKSKPNQYLHSIMKNVISAVVFGAVSSLVFCFLQPYYNKLFDNNVAKVVRFGALSATPSPTPAAEKKKEVKIIKNTVDASIKDFSKMYSLISDLAAQVNHSVVTVSSIPGAGGMPDIKLESTDASYGIVIANNDKELLILSSKDRIKDVKNISVTFEDNRTVKAHLNGADNDTGVAVLSVPLEDIPVNTMGKVKVAELGETASISVGLPVMALGSPNGYVYSMETGIITNKNSIRPIADYQVDLYNTDIKGSADGEGIIVNMEGKVLGVITHKFDNEFKENTSTMIGISKLSSIIETFVNKEARTYFGIEAIDTTTECLDKMKAENGIYITGVINNSPAFKAELKNGDVLKAINNESIYSVLSFNDILSSYQPGETVTVTVSRLRKGTPKEMRMEVKLKKRKMK